MLYSDIPVKFVEPFGQNAGVGFITYPIPPTTGTPGRASLDQGFPTTTFDPEASGGNPPFGADMNGILYQATAWIRYATAGGFPTVYDSAFSSAIGGYPQGALLRASTIGNGKYWISTVNNNTSNPDAAGANWIAFPDLAVQKQNPNYAVDTGAANAVTIALSPATAFADLVGSPVRVKILHDTTVVAPTITINGSSPATMINADGSALAIGQLTAGNIMEGFPRDDGKFQVNTPSKAAGAGSTFPITGLVFPWLTETVPTGYLEINGATLLIASYPNLFNLIGTLYGGDGVTTFKLPDFRGEFLRGWDHGRGLDPNAGTRTNAGGGVTGDHVGTNELGCAGIITLTGAAAQIDNWQMYGTPFSPQTTPPGPPGWYGVNWNAVNAPPVPDPGTTMQVASPYAYNAIGTIPSIRGTMSLSGSSGPETRPTNINVMWIVAI